jgi:hypothetical protein
MPAGSKPASPTSSSSSTDSSLVKGGSVLTAARALW